MADKTSPRVIIRRFLLAVATEKCPDILVNAREAEEYGEALGDKNKWYWAGYADSALALAETGTRMAEDEVIEAVSDVIEQFEFERDERKRRRQLVQDEEERLREAGAHFDEPSLWDFLNRTVE